MERNHVAHREKLDHAHARLDEHSETASHAQARLDEVHESAAKAHARVAAEAQRVDEAHALLGAHHERVSHAHARHDELHERLATVYERLEEHRTWRSGVDEVHARLDAKIADAAAPPPAPQDAAPDAPGMHPDAVRSLVEAEVARRLASVAPAPAAAARARSPSPAWLERIDSHAGPHARASRGGALPGAADVAWEETPVGALSDSDEEESEAEAQRWSRVVRPRPRLRLRPSLPRRADRERWRADPRASAAHGCLRRGRSGRWTSTACRRTAPTALSPAACHAHRPRSSTRRRPRCSSRMRPPPCLSVAYRAGPSRVSGVKCPLRFANVRNRGGPVRRRARRSRSPPHGAVPRLTPSPPRSHTQTELVASLAARAGTAAQLGGAEWEVAADHDLEAGEHSACRNPPRFAPRLPHTPRARRRRRRR